MPNTSTSMSFVGCPRSRSRTHPPTISARPPAPRTARAISSTSAPGTSCTSCTYRTYCTPCTYRTPRTPRPRDTPRTLHFDLHAELDHSLGRQLEERCGADGIARHEDKQLLAPDRHSLAARYDDRLAPEEVRHVFRVNRYAELAHAQQCFRNVRILHEPVLHFGVVDTVAHRLHSDALVFRHVRHRRSGDGQHDDVLVEDLVVAQVVREGRRRA